MEGLNDVLLDATAWGDVVALGLGPFPDRPVLVPAGRGPGAAGPGAYAPGHPGGDPAAVLDEGREFVAQLLGIPGGQVDFELLPIQGELHRLVGDSAVEVIH